jgi:predicted ribosome quality control (RQC) complex YloA/Tae2 family protein
VHNNYYFLKQLSRKLSDEWVGVTLGDIYTQERNELIIQGYTPDGKELYLKAHLSPSFCCLSFPEGHHRARKNSMNLFRETADTSITGVHQFLNERAFCFYLENELMLLFKMFGNRSNILLYRNHELVDIFRSELKNDLNLSPMLDRPLNQHWEAFENAGGEYKRLFPTFGKDVSHYLESRGYHDKDLRGRWELIQNVLQLLDQGEYHVTEDQTYRLSLLPESGKTFSDPIKALNYFFQNYFMRGILLKEKTAVLQELTKELSKTNRYLNNGYRKLEEITSRTSYRHRADLLMANLHNIERGQKEVTLENFYDEGKPLTISLNPTLSPQENAGNFYQKGKNQYKEIQQLELNMEEREKRLNVLKDQEASINEIDDLKTLRQYLASQGLNKTTEAKSQVTVPYHEFSFQGYMIRVGKNAKANDLMLQQYSFKEDLWLHAKDVAGSHVLIKYQAGKVFPAPVIEKAAQLAAYYSKRKNETLCPVIVTPRKYVRKRKGDPAGMVAVDREQEVLLVSPDNY